MSEGRQAGLGCARCGACCEKIPLAPPGTQARELLERGGFSDNPRLREDLVFTIAHWTQLPDAPGYSACDQFDPATRLCRSQESKPPVCRDFPWYTFKPERIAPALPPQCSFLLEVPPASRPPGARPLIPIEVITR